ncbi:type II secretion system minor pseudopilin [Ostreibacterium oceani]|uniref:T2SS protein K first SAM-like domain-containing protein n=1 Tax=Ostreibacterium oceani TaxID=2654998 RepID=A0A6N7ES96_9GAMM|nr:type II secretion system protein GspK [Ostreibacterium oceani]MPV85724.1 hypothetical protein [Ostreibacterium oceani]
MKKQQGIVLIAVLVAMGVLLSLSANYVLNVNRETEAIDVVSTRVQARYSAYSGVNYAMYAMQDSDAEVRWKPDGRLYQATFSGGEVFVRIVSEAGRVDINQADQGLLTLLFVYAGLEEVDAEQLADNVMHWRGAGDVPVGSSVSDADYLQADLPLPKHRRFLFTEELAQVYGVSPATYRQIKPLITVYGGRKIDAMAAPDAVLAMLGLDEAAIAEVHALREAQHNDEVIAVESTELFGSYLAFGVRSRHYRVLSYAITPDGQSESVYAVMQARPDRNGAFQILVRGLLDAESKQGLIAAAEQRQQELVAE